VVSTGRFDWSVKVDAHSYGLTNGGSEDDAIGTTYRAIAYVDPSPPGKWIVIGDKGGGSLVPGPPDFDPHVRVGNQILDVIASKTVFRHDPER